MAQKVACCACGGSRAKQTLSVPEQYFGWSEKFLYDQCEHCGTMSLREVPQELGIYYGADYYSMKQAERAKGSSLVRRLRAIRSDYCLNRKRVWSRVLGPTFVKFTGRAEVIQRYGNWMRAADVSSASIVADVGCGQGHYLWGLYHEGFSRVYGFDPFLDASVQIGSQGYITNTSIEELPGDIDFMLMNHSLEHVAKPLELLAACLRRLATDGHLLVRMPIADNPLFDIYGVHWVGLDAPRHVHIFSESGALALLERCGFKVVASERYTHSFQWIISEQLRRGVPLAAPDSFVNNPSTNLFSAKELRSLEAKAADLIEAGGGDCITVLACRP